jgi:hypothetical protein
VSIFIPGLESLFLSLSLSDTKRREFKDKPLAKRGRHGRSAMLGPNEVIHNWIMEKKK